MAAIIRKTDPSSTIVARDDLESSALARVATKVVAVHGHSLSATTGAAIVHLTEAERITAANQSFPVATIGTMVASAARLSSHESVGCTAYRVRVELPDFKKIIYSVRSPADEEILILELKNFLSDHLSLTIEGESDGWFTSRLEEAFSRIGIGEVKKNSFHFSYDSFDGNDDIKGLSSEPVFRSAGMAVQLYPKVRERGIVGEVERIVFENGVIEEIQDCRKFSGGMYKTGIRRYPNGRIEKGRFLTISETSSAGAIVTGCRTEADRCIYCSPELLADESLIINFGLVEIDGETRLMPVQRIARGEYIPFKGVPLEALLQAAQNPVSKNILNRVFTHEKNTLEAAAFFSMLCLPDANGNLLLLTLETEALLEVLNIYRRLRIPIDRRAAEVLEWVEKAYQGTCTFSDDDFRGLSAKLKGSLYTIANLYCNEEFVDRLNRLGMAAETPSVSSPAIIGQNMDIVIIRRILQHYLEGMRKAGLLMTREEFLKLEPSRAAKLRKKGFGGFDRVLGRDFVEKTVRLLGCERVKVPQKIIVIEDGKPLSISIGVDQSLTLNNKFTLYADDIHPVARFLTRKEMEQLLVVVEAVGARDFAGKNFLIAADGVYMIDTKVESFASMPGLFGHPDLLISLLEEKDHAWFREILARKQAAFAAGHEERQARLAMLNRAREVDCLKFGFSHSRRLIFDRVF